MAEKNTNPKNSLIDVAADLIGNSGINLETVVDVAANAISGSKKKSSSSRKKKSKSDDLISKLMPALDFPQFSEKTYWAIRDEFQKDVPDEVTASTLAKVTGLKADTVKDYILPALGLLGLLKNDGKPTSKLKSWLNDAKYVDTCLDIAEAVYPDALRKLGFKTADQQKNALNWFAKNARVSASTAKKMLGVYLLFVDPKLKAAAKKKASSSTKKSSDSKASIDSLKVTKKGDTASISLKILADESITKKALTELFADAAAEAFKQIK